MDANTSPDRFVISQHKLVLRFYHSFHLPKLWFLSSGLDVNRTDRTLVFYEKKENLSKLWDILALYAWIDNDVGYCQGMSDLCSPMIMLLEDEADAFWCFERLMRRLVLCSLYLSVHSQF